LGERAQLEEAAASATLPWSSDDGRRWLTAVVKVTIALDGPRRGMLVCPRPLTDEDRVPCKAYAEVLARGHARRATGPRLVGVAIARGRRILVQKRVVVRAGPAGGPFDLEAAAPGFIVDANDPRVSTRLGETPASRAARSARAGEWVIGQSADLRTLQCALPDQWLPALRGGERIRITGFDALEDTHVRLPELVAAAVLAQPGARSLPIPLRCDTVVVEAEERVATLTFRGFIAAPSMGFAPEHVRVALVPSVAGPDNGPPREWIDGKRRSPSPAVDPLEVLNRSGFACWTSRFSFEPGQKRRIVIAKATFALDLDGRSLRIAAEQVRPAPDSHGETGELDVASDFAPVKREVDVLVRGTAHAAPGVSSVVVNVEVGPVRNALVVFGERSWGAQGIPTRPVPFQSLALGWTHAFGGPNVLENPVGSGSSAASGPPRIEARDGRLRMAGDRVSPAGVSPISPNWSVRERLLGTFDAAWERDRWPYMPADMDPAYYQAAVPPMRAPVMPEDAHLRLEGLRADGGVVDTTLPGLRPRVLLHREGHAGLEVQMRLDTVTIDTDLSRVFVVWRGSYAMPPGPRVGERLLIVRDSLGEPLSDEHLQILSAVATADGWQDRVRWEGADGAVTLQALIRSWKALTSPQVNEHAEGGASTLTPATQSEVAAILSRGDTLARRDLSLAMLAGMNLRGVDLRGAILRGADLSDASLEGADLTGAVLSSAHGRGARFDSANLARCDFTGARLNGASFREAKLDNAAFVGAKLEESHWNGAVGRGVSFIGATLGRANVAGATLRKANFTEATLDGTNFGGADLTEAVFQEATTHGARFDQAIIADARFELARCDGASFREVRAAGSTWDGAGVAETDFTNGDLRRCIFGATRLTGANLVGAIAEGATFREADLSGADLSGADLRGISLEDAVLDGARLVAANLHGASFFGASLQNTDFREALLTATRPLRRGA